MPASAAPASASPPVTGPADSLQTAATQLVNMNQTEAATQPAITAGPVPTTQPQGNFI